MLTSLKPIDMKAFAAALLIACAGCPADDDETTGATATETGTDPTTSSTTATTASTSTETASTSASSSEDGSSGTSEDTGPSDSSGSESTGHDGSTGHDSGSSSSGATLCEILGEGCHDNATDEGQACHLIGHDGDEAACEKAFDMCAEICGL